MPFSKCGEKRPPPTLFYSSQNVQKISAIISNCFVKKKRLDTNVWLKWNRYDSGQVIRGQWPQVDVEEMLTIHMPASSCLGIRLNNKFTASLALDLSYTSCNSAFTGRAKYYNTLSPGQFYFIKSWHNSNKGERGPWHRTLGIRIIKIQNIGF